MVRGAVDVDIGANASAEGGEDESVDDQAVKVVDIIDTFRLQVGTRHHQNSYYWIDSAYGLCRQIFLLSCIVEFMVGVEFDLHT